MFLCTWLDQGSLRDHFGRAGETTETSKMKENERFYGFTDFRGKPARRGGERHAPASQVTAGWDWERILASPDIALDVL